MKYAYYLSGLMSAGLSGYDVSHGNYGLATFFALVAMAMFISSNK